MPTGELAAEYCALEPAAAAVAAQASPESQGTVGSAAAARASSSVVSAAVASAADAPASLSEPSMEKKSAEWSVEKILERYRVGYNTVKEFVEASQSCQSGDVWGRHFRHQLEHRDDP